MPMRLAKLRMLYAFYLFRLPPWSIELAGSLQCPDCVEAKQARPQPPANLNPIPQLWEIVGTDIYEFEYEDHKHKFILSCFGSWKNGDHDLYHVISFCKLELITIYNRYIVFFPLNKFCTKPLNQFCSTFSSFILPTFLWHLPWSRDWNCWLKFPFGLNLRDLASKNQGPSPFFGAETRTKHVESWKTSSILCLCLPILAASSSSAILMFNVPILVVWIILNPYSLIVKSVTCSMDPAI